MDCNPPASSWNSVVHGVGLTSFCRWKYIKFVKLTSSSSLLNELIAHKPIELFFFFGCDSFAQEVTNLQTQHFLLVGWRSWRSILVLQEISAPLYTILPIRSTTWRHSGVWGALLREMISNCFVNKTWVGYSVTWKEMMINNSGRTNPQ